MQAPVSAITVCMINATSTPKSEEQQGERGGERPRERPTCQTLLAPRAKPSTLQSSRVSFTEASTEQASFVAAALPTSLSQHSLSVSGPVHHPPVRPNRPILMMQPSSVGDGGVILRRGQPYRPCVASASSAPHLSGASPRTLHRTLGTTTTTRALHMQASQEDQPQQQQHHLHASSQCTGHSRRQLLLLLPLALSVAPPAGPAAARSTNLTFGPNEELPIPNELPLVPLEQMLEAPQDRFAYSYSFSSDIPQQLRPNEYYRLLVQYVHTHTRSLYMAPPHSLPPRPHVLILDASLPLDPPPPCAHS